MRSTSSRAGVPDAKSIIDPPDSPRESPGVAKIVTGLNACIVAGMGRAAVRALPHGATSVVARGQELSPELGPWGGVFVHAASLAGPRFAPETSCEGLASPSRQRSLDPPATIRLIEHPRDTVWLDTYSRCLGGWASSSKPGTILHRLDAGCLPTHQRTSSRLTRRAVDPLSSRGVVSDTPARSFLRIAPLRRTVLSSHPRPRTPIPTSGH